MVMNIHADYTLLNLKNKGGTIKEYKIPYGGLFEFVSCANYCKLFIALSF